jgi:ParB family chromosome partitioning protein
MNSIDLDPASCAAANEIVKAARYYTKEENGLEQSWHGRVWLNPPYGRSENMQARGLSMIRAFTNKLVSEYRAGHVEQAVILATAEINAQWFQPLWQFPVCIPDHRVRFIVPAKLDKYSQMFGTTFVYLGSNKQKFTETFGQFGHVVERINNPKAAPVACELWEVSYAS